MGKKVGPVFQKKSSLISQPVKRPLCIVSFTVDSWKLIVQFRIHKAVTTFHLEHISIGKDWSFFKGWHHTTVWCLCVCILPTYYTCQLWYNVNSWVTLLSRLRSPSGRDCFICSCKHPTCAYHTQAGSQFFSSHSFPVPAAGLIPSPSSAQAHCGV